MPHIRLSARVAVALLAALAVPATAGAQVGAPPVASRPDSVAPVPAPDPVFARAQQLVSEGHGTAGRALVDSVLAIATPATPAYAEALFWRASLSTTSADAERDYRRLAVEFPLSPRAEDALLRLAQLELARGDRALAVKHLERLTLEHPTGASRPRASYWMARILFEQNDVPGACAAIAGARTTVPPSDVELRNQIEYTARRCARYDAQRTADSAAAFATAPDSARPASVAASTPASAARDSTTAATPPAATTPPAGAATPARPAAAAATRPAPAATRFAVQVAAFDTKAGAQALVTRLGKSGVTAHVAGSAKPFRVRVGRFATRADAVREQQRLAARRISGFVVAEDASP